MKLTEDMHLIISMQNTAHLLASCQEPTTTRQMANRLGLNRKTIQNRMRALEGAGRVRRAGKAGHETLWVRA